MGQAIDRRTFYYGQPVQQDELNAAFQAVDQGFSDREIDHGSYGVCEHPAGTPPNMLQATELGVPAMGAQVAIGRAITPEGDRMVRLVSTDTVNLALDKDGVSTIPSGGNERYISVFMVPAYQESDGRVDNNGTAINFVKQLLHAFEVVSGAEASAGTAVKPAVRTDAVLLFDVLLNNSSTTITNPSTPTSPALDEIDETRKEWYTRRAVRGIFNDSVEAKYLKLKNAGGATPGWGFNDEGRVHLENTVRAWAHTTGLTGGNKSSMDLSATRTGTGVYQYSLGASWAVFSSSDDYLVFVSTDSQFSAGNSIQVYDVTRDSNEQFTVRWYAMDTSAGTWTLTDVDHEVMVVGRPDISVEGPLVS